MQIFDLTTSYAPTDHDQYARLVTVAHQRMRTDTKNTEIVTNIATGLGRLTGQSLLADNGGPMPIVLDNATGAIALIAQHQRYYANYSTWRDRYSPAIAMHANTPHYLAETVRLNGLTIVEADHSFWRPQQERVDERTNSLLLIHPGNPSGHEYSEVEFRQLVGDCKDRGIRLIIDCAHICYGQSKAYDQLAIMRDSGVSWLAIFETKKTLGLHQQGIAMIVGSEDEMRTLAELRKPLTPPSPFGLAMVEAIMAETAADTIPAVINAAANWGAAADIGLELEGKPGMPFAMLRFNGPCGWAKHILGEHGIQAVPASEYHTERSPTSQWDERIRISMNGNPQDARAALTALSEVRSGINNQLNGHIVEWTKRFGS